MTLSIMWEFTQSFCVLFFITYIFSKLKIIRDHLTTKPSQLREKLVLAILFGALGCAGSSIGIEFNDSLINTRVIGVAMGGLIGGPLVGILSGAIAAIHRVYFVSAGKATAVVCGVSMLIEGMLAGMLSRFSLRFKNLATLATLTAVLCELFRKLMLLWFIKPYDFALLLVRNMTLPMLIINSLGTALFVTYIEAVAREKDQLAAKQSQIVLSIMEKISTAFRRGLTGDNLSDVIVALSENTDFTHILITDFAVPIVSNLDNDEQNSINLPIREFSRCSWSEERGQIFEVSGLSFVVAPLMDDTQIAGFLCLGKAQALTFYDNKLAVGLGKIFSTQLTIGNFEYQSELLKEAEIRILQAQINPHFLFNTMSAISSFCRTDPQEARRLVEKLAEFYRKNMRITAHLVSLRDEIDHVDAYLEIIKARYKGKLDVAYDIGGDIDCMLPPLSLQPLVENAVKYGLLPRRMGGLITIRAKRESDTVRIVVEDNGCGFDTNRPPDSKSNKVGLKNVEKRLKGCFGNEMIWDISSEPDKGTRVTIQIPAISGA